MVPLPGIEEDEKKPKKIQTRKKVRPMQTGPGISVNGGRFRTKGSLLPV